MPAAAPTIPCCLRWILLLAWLGSAGALPAATSVTNLLVAAGSWWRYQDDGSNLGTAWRAPDFDDRSWPGGYAELGYGDFDEETTLGYGTNAASKHITYYFRTDFPVGAAATYASLQLHVLRDDGVVLYLNGAEIWRNNMPAGAIGYRTLAVTNVTRGGETAFVTATVPAAGLIEGRNVLAAEIHQVSPENADLSFDLQLSGVQVAPRVIRGPYLQKAGPTNITVRWRTDVPTDASVRYGSNPTNLLFSRSDPELSTEHEVELTGLTPGARYYYSVGTAMLTAAGDASHTFMTAPPEARPTRVWVIGDAGTASAGQRAVYTAYRNHAAGRPTDVWLLLGDNAYSSGYDHEYQQAVFDMYPELLRQTTAWSTIGNHETYSGSFADFPFLHLFTQPTQGECGGVPSGTERYFSFNHANIHFVCLDSMTSDRSPGGAMAQWLEADLMVNTQTWTIAFWHHPPYSRGSHNSDWETELIEMRQNLGPILESQGVDLVLAGHSHSYERSYLLSGHYGASDTFQSSMRIDAGDGRLDGDGPYHKPTAGPGAHEGTVYVVAGSAGQTSGGWLDHPVMFYNANRLGSLVLDIDGAVLHGAFLRETGAIDDRFTLLKGDIGGPPRLASIQVTAGQVELRWSSRPDRLYRVEQTSGLPATNWTMVASDLPGTGNSLVWTLPVSAAPGGAFFRVVEYTD